MIDEKKIEAAATAYAKEVFCHEKEQTSCMDGFIIGAKWMRQEFAKQLWHAMVNSHKRREARNESNRT